MLTGLFDWISGREGANPSDSTITSAHEKAPQVELKASSRDRFIGRGVLGRGGMSAVLRVHDQNLDREVAMKVLDPARALSPQEVSAFIYEARMTARLDHPNVPAVHEAGVDHRGLAYFIMRMIDGQTLQDRVKAADTSRPFEETLQENLLILLKVCDAVSFAHSRGLIHCDLKPLNIMTGSFGEVYVLDWGIARSKDAPPPVPQGSFVEVVGTPTYMAPEQARGDQLDERTDVFGLGGILYFILTGASPFSGSGGAEGAVDRARECVFKDPQALAQGILPQPLCDIVAKAMAKDPRNRYKSAGDLKLAIERYLRGGLGTLVRTFAPGESIVREGDDGDTAFLITRGHCQAVKTIDGERRVLREMGPGDVFGELAVILSEPRTATVEALDEVTVQVVGRDQLEKGFQMHPWLGRIVHTLTERFRDLDAKLNGS